MPTQYEAAWISLAILTKVAYDKNRTVRNLAPFAFSQSEVENLAQKIWGVNIPANILNNSINVSSNTDRNYVHRRGMNAFRLLYENEGGFKNTEIDFDNYRIREILQVPVNNTYITLLDLKFFINSEYKRIVDQSGEALNSQTLDQNSKSDISNELH